MDKVAIFGAGIIGQAVYALLKSDYQVVCFFDNYAATRSDFDGIPIISLSENIDFDKLYIAVINQDIFYNIKKQLIAAGVPLNKIHSYKEVLLYRARLEFLHEFALKIKQQDISLNKDVAAYATAEVGCFRGEFAKEINIAFAGCKLYLFDTFEGFEVKDIDLEYMADKCVIQSYSKQFAQTSEQLVRDNMPYPADVIIKKGYFPDTFDLVNKNFIFVSIDTDLYAPTKSACELFFPLLLQQGLMLVHDYYNEILPGVKQAVDEFVRLTGADFFPIGDAMSVAIIKRG